MEQKQIEQIKNNVAVETLEKNLRELYPKVVTLKVDIALLKTKKPNEVIGKKALGGTVGHSQAYQDIYAKDVIADKEQELQWFEERIALVEHELLKLK